jgi:hypothetical protein
VCVTSPLPGDWSRRRGVSPATVTPASRRGRRRPRVRSRRSGGA